jgi:2-polyprenyl-3-methyl-5-hydroxy-6-metoxy-1,4-benzoquinol methylase
MKTCRLCGASEPLLLIDFGAHPIAHRFLTHPSQEEYVHPARLFFCKKCGLTQLMDPVPPHMLYTEYVTLSSWKNQPHIPRLRTLVSQLPGVGKEAKIIEVGSNDGRFLKMLKDHGYRKLLGVEPAQDALQAASQQGIETVGDYFTPVTARDIVSSRGKCDVLIARQVLEHIRDLEDFQESIRIVLRPGGYVLLELPNFEFVLRYLDYSAIWEEHVNYFTIHTLAMFLRDVGIRIIHEETLLFSGEALIVIGRMEEGLSTAVEKSNINGLFAMCTAYRDCWPRFRDAFRNYLLEHRRAGKKIAVYGGGCRTSTIINFVGLAPHIEFVLDDQPEKQGKFMPGSHLPILSGETLETADIHLCILAVNAENEEKVIRRRGRYVSRGGRFVSMHPPSHRILPFWPQLQGAGFMTQKRHSSDIAS